MESVIVENCAVNADKICESLAGLNLVDDDACTWLNNLRIN
jgi:hypothetical protein